MSEPVDGQRDENTRERLQVIARLIDEELPQEWGFALFVFPLGGGPGRVRYVAKGDRANIAEIIRDWLEH